MLKDDRRTVIPVTIVIGKTMYSSINRSKYRGSGWCPDIDSQMKAACLLTGEKFASFIDQSVLIVFSDPKGCIFFFQCLKDEFSKCFFVIEIDFLQCVIIHGKIKDYTGVFFNIKRCDRMKMGLMSKKRFRKTIHISNLAKQIFNQGVFTHCIYRNMTKPYADFDREEYPMIKVTFTGEKATESNFQNYLTELLKNYDKREKIAILFDATRAKFPPVRYQRLQAAWMKDHDKLMKDYCAGIAYTIPNSIIRKALTLIFAIQKQPVPFKVFPENTKSYDWLKSLLKKSD